jgi:hypothetical protein
MTKFLSFAAVTLAAILLTAPASAAPLGMVGQQAAIEQPLAEPVHYRRCWYHDGHRHCRRHVARYYYREPYYYGYGPGINLYFGGGRHWGHHRWHRW